MLTRLAFYSPSAIQKLILPAVAFASRCEVEPQISACAPDAITRHAPRAPSAARRISARCIFHSSLFYSLHFMLFQKDARHVIPFSPPQTCQHTARPAVMSLASQRFPRKTSKKSELRRRRTGLTPSRWAHRHLRQEHGPSGQLLLHLSPLVTLALRPLMWFRLLPPLLTTLQTVPTAC